MILKINVDRIYDDGTRLFYSRKYKKAIKNMMNLLSLIQLI